MPSRPPAAILALALAACGAPAAPAAIPEDDPVVERPAPSPRKPTQADFEAAWVRVEDPPPLGAVPAADAPPDPCILGTAAASTEACQLRRDACRGDDTAECQAMYPSCDDDPHPENPNCVVRRPKCKRPRVRCNPPPPE